MKYTDGVTANMLKDLGFNLEIALAEYATAKDKLKIAQTEEISALNKLNTAQAAFDAFLVKMRKEAPRQSSWKSSEGTGVAIKE